MSQNTNTWRLLITDPLLDAVDFDSMKSVDELANAVVNVVREALEHYYAPQLHNSMHPADLVTKVFELPGHENLVLPRTWEEAS